MINSNFDVAIAQLRAAGWTVTPPLAETVHIEVGQVWISPRPKEEARTVVRFGRHRWYPSAGDQAVFFTTATQGVEQDKGYPKFAFACWIVESGAYLAEG